MNEVKNVTIRKLKVKKWRPTSPNKNTAPWQRIFSFKTVVSVPFRVTTDGRFQIFVIAILMRTWSRNRLALTCTVFSTLLVIPSFFNFPFTKTWNALVMQPRRGSIHHFILRDWKIHWSFVKGKLKKERKIEKREGD